ncbi:MAG TPA: Na+/H+ antiporter subunit E [Parvibaculum sp.]
MAAGITRSISLGTVLFGFWLVLSGHYTPFLLSMGVASTVLCVWIAARMWTPVTDPAPSRFKPSLSLYWFWLGGEIVKSNLAVARIILARRISISHRFILVPTSQQGDLARVVFANSITLTPGTVTVETGENSLLVHALAEPFASSLPDMDRRVTAVEAR